MLASGAGHNIVMIYNHTFHSGSSRGFFLMLSQGVFPTHLRIRHPDLLKAAL